MIQDHEQNLMSGIYKGCECFFNFLENNVILYVGPKEPNYHPNNFNLFTLSPWSWMKWWLQFSRTSCPIQHSNRAKSKKSTSMRLILYRSCHNTVQKVMVPNHIPPSKIHILAGNLSKINCAKRIPIVQYLHEVSQHQNLEERHFFY